MNTLNTMKCSFPATVDEALALMADAATRGVPLAGGTDLMVQWQSGVVPVPDRAISLHALDEMQQISKTQGTLVIGAGVTHARLRASADVQQALPALAAAAGTIGAAQIQARGTISGNVANASPAGDLAPALLITDGHVVVASVRGERTVPLTDFFLGYRKIDLQPDELIVRFLLPACPDGYTEQFRKVGTRAAQSISKIMAACRMQTDDGIVRQAAIALGSVAPTVVRLPELEHWLAGKGLCMERAAEAEQRAAAEVKPIDDIRSTAEYRKWISGRLVRDFLINAM
jgi:CO/xanthine dehydrogenase FAD-binding subunit